MGLTACPTLLSDGVTSSKLRARSVLNSSRRSTLTVQLLKEILTSVSEEIWMILISCSMVHYTWYSTWYQWFTPSKWFDSSILHRLTVSDSKFTDKFGTNTADALEALSTVEEITGYLSIHTNNLFTNFRFLRCLQENFHYGLLFYVVDVSILYWSQNGSSQFNGMLSTTHLNSININYEPSVPGPKLYKHYLYE